MLRIPRGEGMCHRNDELATGTNFSVWSAPVVVFCHSDSSIHSLVQSLALVRQKWVPLSSASLSICATPWRSCRVYFNLCVLITPRESIVSLLLGASQLLAALEAQLDIKLCFVVACCACSSFCIMS